MNEAAPLLTTDQLSIGYPSKGNAKVVSQDLNLQLFPGKLVCLLGSNGSGKSTLMRTLAGLQPSLSGSVSIGDQLLANLHPESLAQKLSLVLTERIEVGNLTAREVVTLGRTPYTNWLGSLSDIDKSKIDQAVANADIETLLDKKINRLSDGERQKVMLGRALAQDTELILLDEPTAHLDLPSRIEMMKLLHRLARQTQKAILLSTHELDLALQTADVLWLMGHDGKVSTGTPEDLILNGSFENAFAKNGLYFDKASGTFNVRQDDSDRFVIVTGDERLVYWTKRAFVREGWGISNEQDAHFHIMSAIEGENPVWLVKSQAPNVSFTSINALLGYLATIRK